MEFLQNGLGDLCSLYFMDPYQLGIRWVWTKSGQLQGFRNYLPADVMEEDPGNDNFVIPRLLF